MSCCGDYYVRLQRMSSLLWHITELLQPELAWRSQQRSRTLLLTLVLCVWSSASTRLEFSLSCYVYPKGLLIWAALDSRLLDGHGSADCIRFNIPANRLRNPTFTRVFKPVVHPNFAQSLPTYSMVQRHQIASFMLHPDILDIAEYPIEFCEVRYDSHGSLDRLAWATALNIMLT